MAVFGEEGDECPICLETMPVTTFRDEERNVAMCCGNTICRSCQKVHFCRQDNLMAKLMSTNNPDSLRELQADFAQSSKCPLCRASIPRNQKEEFNLAMKNAQKGKAWAQYVVASHYEHGAGAREDRKKAVHWYSLAAKQGHPWAMCSYGYNLIEGIGVPRPSIIEGKGWLEKSVECGYAKAQNHLAEFYYDGKGKGSDSIPQDHEKAAHLAQLSADQGFDPGECLLGLFYDKGHGVPQDYEKAAYWYRRAAEQGNAIAMNNLMLSLMNHTQKQYGRVDECGNCPIPEAVKWARKAAAEGVSGYPAQFVKRWEMAYSMECANCNKRAYRGNILSKCAKCRLFQYCSKECQITHWKAGHKIDCCKQD